MPTDYIKAADLHAALARVRDETKAKVWAEAYAAGQKAEQEQYAKAVQLVTLGRALGGFGPVPAVVTQQFPVAPVVSDEPAVETKAFVEDPSYPRRQNPDGPAYGDMLQVGEGWVHPDGALTVLKNKAESHVGALAEADPGVKAEFHAAIARHAHRGKYQADFVDDDVKDHAFGKGFIHITSGGRVIEATGKHEMLLKHRKFLKELAMRSVRLVFRPVDGDDYEVKAKREGKALPVDPNYQTTNVVASHHDVTNDPHNSNVRHMHADILSDEGNEEGMAAVQHYVASVGHHDEEQWRDNLINHFGSPGAAAQAVTHHAVEHLNSLHPDENTDNTPDWHVSAYIDGRAARNAANEAIGPAPHFSYRTGTGEYRTSPEVDPVRMERFRQSRHNDARFYHQNVVRAAEHPESVQLYDENDQPSASTNTTAPEHLQHVALLHHAAARIHAYARDTKPEPTEAKAIPANPRHRTSDVIGTHAVVQDALSRGDTQYANRQREIHADALDDAGAVREAALERVLAGQQPASHLAATFKNAANLKRAARSRTEAAHEASAEAYQRSLHHGEPDDNGFPRPHSRHVEAAWDWSYQGRFYAQTGQHLTAGNYQSQTAKYHGAAGAHYAELASTHPDQPEFAELAALHRHAAEQHRVAAAYNAAAHHADSTRTVKAQEDYHPRFRDELHDAGRQHEMDGPPTPGLRSQEAYVVSDRLMDEALHTHGLHVPYSSLENAHEKAFDAADIGDDAGRRYWHRRARDLHILMRGQLGATPGDPMRQAHEKAMSLHGKASADDSANRQVLRDHASLDGEEQAQVAHAIGSHGGDVSAAARTATAAANKLTDPEKDFGTVARAWGVPVVAKDHHKASAAHAVVSQNIPRDTPYRAAIATDVPDDVSGFNVTFYKPSATHPGRRVEWFPTNHPTRDTAGGFSMPVRSSHGQNADITHENVGEWSVYDVDTERRRVDATSAHRIASYLHQEAATGDHLNREVKAHYTNWDKAEQHEGPDVDFPNMVGDYTEDDADPANPVHSQFYRSNKLFEASERAGHLHTLHRQYPDLDPHAINEKMLDAADLGDEAGHRYWKRRLGDAHLLVADQARQSGDQETYEEHGKTAARLYGTYLDSDIHTPAAHLIAHHKGDVGAAAKHASEAAIKATDPDILKTARRGGNLEAIDFNTGATSGSEYHIGSMYKHIDAEHAIRNAPDPYRPATHADVDAALSGKSQVRFHSTAKNPYTGADEPYSGLAMPAGPFSSVKGDDRNPFKLHLQIAGGIEHVTPDNMHKYTVVDTDARQHRLDLQQMHQVAALLHREAATGDHETREVKADLPGDSDPPAKKREWEMVDPNHLEPVNDVHKDKVKALTAGMKKRGWVGRPLVVVDDQALTGSHRLHAARAAGINVPVYRVTREQIVRASERGGGPTSWEKIRIGNDRDWRDLFKFGGMPLAAKLFDVEEDRNEAFGGPDGWKRDPSIVGRKRAGLPPEAKSYTDDPAPYGYCPGCYSANITERECPACGPRIIPDEVPV